jgi:hypothetical protein
LDILEGETSNKIPVTSGVPQGTVLGPILFLLFINDLAEYIQHSTLRLFADDSIIYKQIKNKEDAIKLQQDLNAAGKWEQDWLMHFHPNKCTVVSVTQKRKTANKRRVLCWMYSSRSFMNMRNNIGASTVP